MMSEQRPSGDFLRPPEVAVGCMRLGAWGAVLNTDDLRKFTEGCLDAGLTLFDHADIYGHYSTEADFGLMLRQAPGLRNRMKIISKCGIRMVSDNRPDHRIKFYDCSKEHIVGSVENSLRDLATDHLDLLLLHRPDYLADPAEIAGAISSLQQAGKVIEFGVSNFSPSQLRTLKSYIPSLAFHQVEISPLHRQAFTDGTLDQCLELGVRPMAWSPLGGGKFSEHVDLRKMLGELSREHGVAAETLVYTWLLRHPAGIIPVTGTSRLDRIREAAAARQVSLSRQDWYRIWTAVAGEVA